jgi:hypothetical protein
MSNARQLASLRADSSGKFGINTTVPQSLLEINLNSSTANVIMDASNTNDGMVIRAPFSGTSTGSVSNSGARWGIRFVGRNDGTYDNGKSAGIYAVSEDTSAGYNRQVGLTFQTSTFDASGTTETMRIKNDGTIVTRYARRDHNFNGNKFIEVRSGRQLGNGSWTLFTKSGSPQSIGIVTVTAIYNTPSTGAYWKYKITGDGNIYTIDSETTGFGGGAAITVSWSGNNLQVANNNSSVYFQVTVELHNIGNEWGATWGNFPGFT